MIVKTPAIDQVIQRQLEESIRSFLEEESALEASIQAAKNPLRPIIDSLVIVEVLVLAETIAGCTLPESIIQKGGYHSVDEAIGHLLPQVMNCWKRHHHG